MLGEMELINEIRQEVIGTFQLEDTLDDDEIKQTIYEVMNQSDKVRIMDLHKRKRVASAVFNSLRKMDILQDLLEDSQITEIMVNGPNHIFYEKGGQLYKWDHTFSSTEKLEDVIQQIVGRNNKMVNESVPIVDTRLADASRVNIVLPPIAVDGAVISIRRFPKEALTMKKLIEMNSIGGEAAMFLANLVRARYNIFISGGTGSGKTTFLNALSMFIPKDERIVTIEDSAELQIQGIENLVRLEIRRANFEGVQEITMTDLIKTALRMRPDRIIVGEVRGREALDMLQAMQSGHDGSLSTGHADSPKDMVHRLETMVLMAMELPLQAVRAQISSGIDIMVHLGRLRDKSRKVLEICELIEGDRGQIIYSPLYQFVEENEQEGKIIGKWVKKNSLQNKTKCKLAGVVPEVL
ncbi:CpaF family protein [Eubacterium oxidoreducens]|uniref:Pilus assembly protein CpaF n=1 Tax=Eubacterium oxidoreducens TaxID=1732 RepID=A0A1G5ZZT7_EUBOX|nr:CpaF family protein [Eubacterium oxidoreducens]SDB01719.1 pilus assembly protein CpaF [Eubacterium oxidoreducens]